MNCLSAGELDRYARHLSLTEIGVAGQQRLKNSKVLCIGAGGLGCSALSYLAAAGVNTIGIVDADKIELSNLQRQVLYSEADIGQFKVTIARDNLLALNPHVNIKTYPVRFTQENAFDIIAPYDVVIDATDNYAARYLINDACFHLQKPTVFACILRFVGQCTVFNAPNGPCYRCLFPTPPAPNEIPNCAEAGVLGALPGLLGSMQAIEAIKLLLHMGTPLIGRVLTMDTLHTKWHELKLERNPDCLLCGKNRAFTDLVRPAEVCQASTIVPEITIQEFKKLRNEKADFFLLDVREPEEYNQANLGGHLIPLKELSLRLHELDPKKMIVVHCQMGGRANKAAILLLNQGFSRVRNLKGGLNAWISETT